MKPYTGFLKMAIFGLEWGVNGKSSALSDLTKTLFSSPWASFDTKNCTSRYREIRTGLNFGYLPYILLAVSSAD